MAYNGDMEKRTCLMPDCPNKIKGHGLCDNHLKKLRRGTLDITGITLTPRKATSEDGREEKYVDKSGDCWLWTGALDTKGYGVTRIDYQLHRAHRWMYARHVGPIPEGMDLDHECHNADLNCPGGDYCKHRACVNPAHLAPATRKVNINNGVIGRSKA